jgi:hypothetical protein
MSRIMTGVSRLADDSQLFNNNNPQSLAAVCLLPLTFGKCGPVLPSFYWP